MRKFTLVAATLLISLILLEACLTLLFYLKDVKGELIHLEDTCDIPYLYYSFTPDSSKGRNEDGLFTRKGREKPVGKYRVMLVGGSVACRLGNAVNDQGIPLMEHYLNESLQTDKIEFVNGGIHGYVAEQEFILTQLFLQYYHPDMIISLDGFNDLTSFRLNRNLTSTPMLPPQNYRDFKVIEEGKFDKSAVSRFAPLFKNTFRMMSFVKNYINGINNYDFSALSDTDYENYAIAYVNILKDLNGFCELKNINYVSAFQPVKYYNNKAANYMISDVEVPEMGKLYHLFENRQKELPRSFSLSSVFDQDLSYYTDICHVNQKGNEIFSKAIAANCKKWIETDSAFIRLTHPQ